MARFKYLLTFSLFLLGICTPSEPPNTQEPLLCVPPSNLRSQALFDASKTLEMSGMTFSQETSSWASATSHQMQGTANLNCSPYTSDPASIRYYEAASVTRLFPPYAASLDIFSAILKTETASVYEGSHGDTQSQASLRSFRAKFNKIFEGRRVSPALMTSFLMIPPFESYTASSISPVVFKILPIQALSSTSELKIDITHAFSLPSDSTSSYICRIDSSNNNCSYDNTSKLLTITGFPSISTSSEVTITIQDTPPISSTRPAGLQYPSTPGLYNIPISLKYSTTYTYIGTQPILVMPSTAPTTASLSLSHTSYMTAIYLENLLTVTLKPSSIYNAGNTIDLYFPVRKNSSTQAFEPSLGLCRRYNISGSTLVCQDKYDISSYDSIPCMDKSNSNIKVSCSIILGDDKLYLPTIIQAQILSVTGSVDTLNLSLMISTPRIPEYEACAIINKSGTYEGACMTSTLSLSSLTSTSGLFNFKSTTSGANTTYQLSMPKISNVSKLWIYLGTTMHKVPSTILNNDIYTDLDILLTSTFTDGVSNIDISFNPNVKPGLLGGLNNLYVLFIGPANTLVAYSALGINSSSRLSSTIPNSSLYDRASVAYNSTSWVTFNITPNMVTDIYTRITFTPVGVNIKSSICFFVDSFGRGDSTVCKVDSNKITISGLSPYTKGSSYAIDITRPDPIKIKAFVVFTTCTAASVRFTFSQASSVTSLNNLEEISYTYTSSPCGISLNSLNAYPTLLEELPVSAVSCTNPSCNNYGEIRFTTNLSGNTAGVTIIYVNTGGQLTTMAPGAKLRCEYISTKGRYPLLCSANQDSYDFKIFTTGLDFWLETEFIISTDGGPTRTNYGFKIPLGSENPIKIELRLTITTQSYITYIDYYPPYKLIDEFSIDFLSVNALDRAGNMLTITLQDNEAAGDETFYLLVSTQYGTLNQFLMDRGDYFYYKEYKDGSKLACIFDNCDSCACYVIASINSNIMPIKVKVVGLDVRTKKTFSLIALPIVFTSSNTRVYFTGELWSSNGAKLAESKVNYVSSGASYGYDQSLRATLDFTYNTIEEGGSNYYDFNINFDATPTDKYTNCLVRLATGDLYPFTKDMIDPSKAKVTETAKEMWILTNSFPSAATYAAFKAKPFKKQYSSFSNPIFYGNIYCFGPNPNSLISTMFSRSDWGTLNYRSENGLSASSVYGSFVSSITNLVIVQYTPPTYWTGVLGMIISVNSGTISSTQDFVEILGLNPFTEYSLQYDNNVSNSFKIVFSSPVEIRSQIKIAFPFAPSSTGSVIFTLRLFGDQMFIYQKNNVSTPGYATVTGSATSDTITTTMLPGSTISNFSFTYTANISTTNSLITIRFPESNYNFVNSFTDMDLAISCPSPTFTCQNFTKTDKAISFTVVGTGSLVATISSSTQNVNIQGGVLVATITKQGSVTYLFQTYDATSSLTFGGMGGSGCPAMFDINVTLRGLLKTGDILRLRETTNLDVLDNYDIFYGSFRQGDQKLSFSCENIIKSKDLSSNKYMSRNIDCYYRDSDTLTSPSITIAFYLIVSSSRTFTLFLQRKTSDRVFMIEKRALPIGSSIGTCDASITALGSESVNLNTRKSISYSLGVSHDIGSYFVFRHYGAIANISTGSNLEIIDHFDLERTFFRAKSAISSFAIQFDFTYVSSSRGVGLETFTRYQSMYRSYSITYTITDGGSLTGYTLTNIRVSPFKTYYYECTYINLEIQFPLGKVDEIELNGGSVVNQSFMNASKVKIYTISNSVETQELGFISQVSKGSSDQMFLKIKGNYLNNTLYRIKNIYICFGSAPPYRLTITTRYNDNLRHTVYNDITLDTIGWELDWTKLKRFAVTTPYLPPKSNNVNSILFTATLPNMPITSPDIGGKITLSLISGATLAESNYYVYFLNQNRVKSYLSYRCSKLNSSVIDCLPPSNVYTGVQWAGDSFSIRVGSPVMNRVAFSNLQPIIKFKLKLSTTWTPSSSSTVYDYESDLTFTYNPIPSAKFEHIYMPALGESQAIGSIFMQTPEEITAGSELNIEFPVCDALIGTVQLGELTPFNSTINDSACAVYDTTDIINTVCNQYSGTYYTDLAECVKSPGFMSVYFNQSVPASTPIEVYLGRVNIMKNYLVSGLKASLRVGNNFYVSKIYEIYFAKSSSLATSVQDLLYPSSLTTNTPINITVPIPSNYDRSKKGYIYFSTNSTSRYINITEDSSITTPGDKYSLQYHLAILPDSVSGSSTNVTLLNVGPLDSTATDYVRIRDYLRAEVFTDESRVGNFTYTLFPAGTTRPTVTISQFTSNQAYSFMDTKSSVPFKTNYNFTVVTSMDMLAGSSLVLTIPLAYHDPNLTTNPSCYLTMNSISLSTCYVTKSTNFVATVHVLNKIPKDTSISLSINLITTSNPTTSITISHIYQTKTLQLSTFTNIPTLTCPLDKFLSPTNTCIDDCNTLNGYYGSTSIPKTCLTCISDCKGCSNGSSCNVCNDEFLRKQDSNGNYLCTKNCGDGFYHGTTAPLTCIACLPICETCIGTGTCTKCKDGKYLYNGGTECVSNCPAVFYNDDNAPKRCVACFSGCASCNSSKCLQCDDDKYLYKNGSECIPDCNAEDKRYISENSPKTCSDCIEFCDRCTKDIICSECSPLKVLHENKECLDSCLVGYYEDGDKVCQKCIEHCISCDNGTICKLCKDTHLLFNDSKKCDVIENCDEENGFYIDETLKACLPCSDNCLSCSDDQTCTKCDSSTYLHEAVCESECPLGFYADDNDSECKICLESCKSCDEESTCIECETDFYLHYDSSACSSACPSEYYGFTEAITLKKKCGKCIEHCISCDDGTICKLCKDTHLLFDDSTKCDVIENCDEENGFYIDETLKACLPCSDNCLSCSDDQTCTKCDSSTYLHDSVCESECPLGFYADDNDSECKKCLESCKSCDEESTCIECETDFYLHYDSLACSSACPSEYYGFTEAITLKKKCGKCIEHCISCDNGTICKLCKDTHLLFDDSTKCDVIENCDEENGFYIDETLKACLPCSDNCLSCSDDQTCTKCDSSTYLHDSVCESECPLGFYADDSDSQCKKCLQSCKSCNEASTCIECETDFYLHYDSSACSSACPEEYYGFTEAITSKKKCGKCIEHCISCDNGTICKLCKDTHLLFDDSTKCDVIENCDEGNGFYIDETLKACLPCLKNCSKCSSTEICDECTSTHFLIDDKKQCISSCPSEGYYPETAGIKICVPCLEDCKYCSKDVPCIECKSGSSLHNNGSSCLQVCPAGFYKGTVSNKSTCVACTNTLPNCAKCSSATACDECTEDYFLLEDSKRCVESCPAQYTTFQTPINTCIFCMRDCITCASKTECAVCAEGFTYLTDPPTCFKNCNEGYFRDNRTCKRCSSDCANCENETKCLTCRQNYYLFETETENKCTYSCPSFYYEDKTSTPASCKSCPENCENCSDSSSCTRCDDGYYLDSSTTCKICPSGCETCSIKNERVVCDTCADGYYKHQNECVDTCPKNLHGIDATKTCEICRSGTYANGRSCLRCPIICQECMSDTVCTHCIEGAQLNSTGLCGCGEGFIQKDNICERKVVTFEASYSDKDRFVRLNLSAPLVIPLGKQNIKIEINGKVLSPEFYILIPDSEGKSYTILFQDYIIGAQSFKLEIVDTEAIMDFEGNPLPEASYDIPLADNPIIPNDQNNEPDDSNSSLEEDDENDSNDALIEVVCPILMSICAIVLLIGFLAPYSVYVWQGINFLQILSYMYLIDLEWPDTISDFLPGILYYNYFPNIFHLIEKEGPSPFENAEDFGYDTSQFLRNNGVIITFFFVVIIVWPIIFLLSKVLSGSTSVTSKLISIIRNSYNWNAYLRVYIDSYLVTAIACLIQLKYLEYDSTNLIINFLAAIFAIVIFT